MNIGYRNAVLREAKEIAECLDEEGMTREAAGRLSDRYEVSFDDAAHDVARCIAAYHAMEREEHFTTLPGNIETDGAQIHFELLQNGERYKTVTTVSLTEVA